jgi:hypothetical protein
MKHIRLSKLQYLHGHQLTCSLIPACMCRWTAGETLAGYADQVYEQIQSYNATFPRRADGTMDLNAFKNWPPFVWYKLNGPSVRAWSCSRCWAACGVLTCSLLLMAIIAAT